MSDESGPRPAEGSDGGNPSERSAQGSGRGSRGRGNGASPSGGRPAMRGSRFFSSVDASLLGLGTQMLSEVVAGVLLGLGLDHILGTKGRWVVVGSIAGVAVAMVTVIRLAMKPQTPRRSAPGSRPTPPVAPEESDAANPSGGPSDQQPSERQQP